MILFKEKTVFKKALFITKRDENQDFSDELTMKVCTEEVVLFSLYLAWC